MIEQLPRLTTGGGADLGRDRRSVRDHTGSPKSTPEAPARPHRTDQKGARYQCAADGPQASAGASCAHPAVHDLPSNSGYRRQHRTPAEPVHDRDGLAQAATSPIWSAPANRAKGKCLQARPRPCAGVMLQRAFLSAIQFFSQNTWVHRATHGEFVSNSDQRVRSSPKA